MTAQDNHAGAPLPAKPERIIISLMIDDMFRQTRQAEGGHLWISRHDYRLYYGRGCWVTGYTPDRALQAAITFGVPVIDVREADQDKLYDVIVNGPIPAVGEAPVRHEYLALSSEALTDFAARYRAIGATLLNMPATDADQATEPRT